MKIFIPFCVLLTFSIRAFAAIENSEEDIAIKEAAKHINKIYLDEIESISNDISEAYKANLDNIRSTKASNPKYDALLEVQSRYGDLMNTITKYQMDTPRSLSKLLLYRHKMKCKEDDNFIGNELNEAAIDAIKEIDKTTEPSYRKIYFYRQGIDAKYDSYVDRFIQAKIKLKKIIQQNPKAFKPE